MIDIIIPTMWRAPHIIDNLEKYCSSNLVNRVIVIDNDSSSRPVLINNPKLEIVSYGKNLYVNPSWNEGVMRAKSDIVCIMNDDISVDNDLFRKVVDFGVEKDAIIGVNLGYKGLDNYTISIDDVPDTITKLNYDRTEPIGGQAWAFGICMFMRRESYKYIPSLYQVWYGDDFLCQRFKEVYALRSSKITGTISETLKAFMDPATDISRRIILDSKNLLRFNHFKNARYWDIPHNMIKGNELKLKHTKSVKNSV